MSAMASPALNSPQSMSDAQLDQLSINCIRTLSIDAVQQAKSGHPGTPMALAPLVYTLWNRVMRFDPQDPIWPDRDRFVLSNGHASMLLWSVLYLTGTRAVNAQYERLGQPAHRDRAELAPVVERQAPVGDPAKVVCLLQDRLEHRCEVTGR